MYDSEHETWTTSTILPSCYIREECLEDLAWTGRHESTNQVDLLDSFATKEWRTCDFKQQLEEKEKSKRCGQSICPMTNYDIDFDKEGYNHILRSDILTLQNSLHVLQCQFDAHLNESCHTQNRLQLENEFLVTQILQLESQTKVAQQESDALRKLLADREKDTIHQLASKDKAILDANLIIDKDSVERQKLESALEEARRAITANEQRVAHLSSLVEQAIQERSDHVEELRRTMMEANKSASRTLNDRIQTLQEKAAKAELAESTTIQMLKETETKLVACLAQNEENLSAQRQSIMIAFQTKANSEIKEVQNRLDLLQLQRESQETQIGNLIEEMCFLRNTHASELSSTMLSITKLREELALTLDIAKQEKERNVELRKQINEANSAFCPLKEKVEALEKEKRLIEAAKEVELHESKAELMKERDERKQDAVAFQQSMESLNDKIQILTKKLHKEHSNYIHSVYSCENDLIQMVRTTFANHMIVAKSAMEEESK